MPLTKEDRAEISRRNGAKSRGPVTTEGKARVGRNAIRHGLLARTILLKGESENRFNRLCETLRAEFHPVGAVESALVENMVAARWRQMRLWSMEQAYIQREVSSAISAFSTTGLDADSADPAPLAGAWDRLKVETLSRHEGRLDRQYDRALRSLQQHRKWRLANPAKD